MAIDTEEKRRAVLGVWSVQRVLPVPDPGINAAEREHVWLYSGIASGGAGPSPGARIRKLISVGLYPNEIDEVD
jgi:hypothetical protein